MVKKKRVVVKKAKIKSSKGIKSVKRKINLVLGNFLIFLILLILSVVLYSASSMEFYISLFFLLSIIFGVISLAFLIALLSLVFLRMLKK